MISVIIKQFIGVIILDFRKSHRVNTFKIVPEKSNIIVYAPINFKKLHCIDVVNPTMLVLSLI